MATRIRIEGTDELRALAKRLKEAGRKDVLAALNKSVRKATKAGADEVKKTVRVLPVQGVRGGGARSRAAHRAARSKGKDAAKNLERAMRRSGLRESVARAVSISVRTGGRSVSVKVRVNHNQLPPDQRALPEYLNNGRWRHPVFGNRHHWVTQTSRAHWFDGTLREHAPAIRTEIAGHVRAATDKI